MGTENKSENVIKVNSFKTFEFWFKVFTLMIASAGLYLGITNYIKNNEQDVFNKNVILKEKSPKVIITDIVKGPTIFGILNTIENGVLQTQVRLKCYIKIRNQSDYACKNINVIITDTVTNHRVTREALLKGKFKLRNDSTTFFGDFQKLTLLPKDSTTIPVNWTIIKPQYSNGESIVYVHIVILYQNDLEGLYDTYTVQKIILYNESILKFLKGEMPRDKNNPNNFISNEKHGLLEIPGLERESDYYSYTISEMDSVASNLNKALKDKK